MTILLWVLQVLLAALYGFAGSMKEILPPEQLTAQFPWPVLFVRFIGVCELLASLGMILPGLLRIKPWLTPLASAGLVIIMIGATGTTIYAMGIGPALIPFALIFLNAFVGYGRWKLRPIAAR